MTDEPLSFSERLAQVRAAKGIVPKPAPTFPQAVPPPAQTGDTTGIPQVYDRTESDQLIDDTIRHIDPLTAYKKWVGKEIKLSDIGQDEVHVSCPFPNHRDEHPSAWLNVRTGQWFCGGCQLGDDLFGLAAVAFGYGSNYKEGANFHRLREDMAKTFGTHIERGPNGKTTAWRDDTPPPASAVPEPVAPSTAPSTPVQQVIPTPVVALAPDSGATQVESPTPPFFQQQVAPTGITLPEPTPLHVVPVDYQDEEEELFYPTLNWRAIIPEDTFLWEYMTAASKDDSPEEYHFWHGMLALGHTVGLNVQLRDQPNVKANMLVCLLGGTGQGKSKSRKYLTQILRDVVPFKDHGDRTTGVKEADVSGSGEMLIKTFEHITKDPTTNKPIGKYNTVNGIVDYDEFSGLLARIKRQGSTLQSTVMKFADCASTVSSASLSSGSIRAEDPFCSITATTQPRALRAILNKTDQASGFLNRWIFAGGPRKEKEVFGGLDPSTTVNMARATDQLKLVKGWGGGTQRLIQIDDQAIIEIVAFFRSTIYPLQKRDKSDMLSRMDLIYKKLLLLMAINQKTEVIDSDLHNRCVEIVDYLVKCYSLVATNIGVTAQHEISDDILRHADRHFQKYGKGVSPRDLRRYTASKKYSDQQLNQALKNLYELHLLSIEEKPPGPGRKTDRYRIAGDM